MREHKFNPLTKIGKENIMVKTKKSHDISIEKRYSDGMTSKRHNDTRSRKDVKMELRRLI